MLTMQVNQLKGLIWGGIVGDALGVPFEFRTRDSFSVTDMVGYGTYDLPPGTWSDDTSMTICTLAHLNEQTDLEDLMQKFVAWTTDDYMTTPSGMFDIGNQTSEALRTWSRSGVAATACGPKSEYANGNGALMRIAPVLSLTYHQPLDVQFQIAERYSSLTHGHMCSIVASFLYLVVLEHLVDGASLKEALATVRDKVQPFFENHAEAQHEYTTHYEVVFQPDFDARARTEIASSGYVVDTFQAMIWCALKYEDFASATMAAVALGEDTDTIASLVGQLKGLELGVEAIPTSWIETTRSHEIINHALTPWVAQWTDEDAKT